MNNVMKPSRNIEEVLEETALYFNNQRSQLSSFQNRIHDLKLQNEKLIEEASNSRKLIASMKHEIESCKLLNKTLENRLEKSEKRFESVDFERKRVILRFHRVWHINQSIREEYMRMRMKIVEICGDLDREEMKYEEVEMMEKELMGEIEKCEEEKGIGIEKSLGSKEEEEEREEEEEEDGQREQNQSADDTLVEFPLVTEMLPQYITVKITERGRKRPFVSSYPGKVFMGEIFRQHEKQGHHWQYFNQGMQVSPKKKLEEICWDKEVKFERQLLVLEAVKIERR